MEMNVILMEEEYWINSQFSIARFFGKIAVNGKTYHVVNKEGKDLAQLSCEAEEHGYDYAIPPGEPADLINEDYLPLYRKYGREKFIEVLKDNRYIKLTPELMERKIITVKSKAI